MDPAAVVLLVKNLDDEHDPDEDTRSLGENFVADFLNLFATSDPEFAFDIADNALCVASLPVENQGKALADANVWEVATGKANKELFGPRNG